MDKQREIDRLKEEVQRLRLKVCANERKSKAGFFGSSTPSSQVPVKANSLALNQAKKGGGKPGHPGVGRQVFSSAEADETRVAEVSVEMCADCECRLNRQSSNERAIYELQREKLHKVYYTLERKVCPKCRKIVSAKVRNAFPRMSLSNELMVEAAEQHYVLGRTLGQIAGRFELPFATLAESLKSIGKKLEPCLEKLIQDYRTSPVRHADETGWRTDGAGGYSWYFGSEQVRSASFQRNPQCECRQRSVRNKTA
ncbi:MAG TPA: transposase [Pyrinomonadaceae bacterium]|nr:transposase [Pyrinomonadaceae bacterium]